MPDKERERHYLAQLRRCIEDLPSGPVSEPEPPDFVLGNSPRRLGIELTELHVPPLDGQRPFQEVQSLKLRVVREAENLFQLAGGPPLYVTVIFGMHGRLDKRSAPGISRRLANALLAAKLPRSISDPSVELPRDSLPLEIAHVHAHGSVDGVDKFWQPDHVDWVRKLLPDDVQRHIDAKIERGEKARRHCDELWLVIVHNHVRGAPAQLTPEAAVATYTFSFNRVLWLDPHGPGVRDLCRNAG